MQNVVEQNGAVENKIVDFDEVVYLFKKKLWILLLITAVATGLGYYKASQMTTRYVANAKIFMSNVENQEEMNYYSFYNMQYYNQFATYFNEIVSASDYINNAVKDKYGKDAKFALNGSISFAGSEGSPIVTGTYYTSSQEGAEEVLDAACDQFVEYSKKIFQDTNVNIIDTAKVYPILPNKKRVIMMYFAIGVVISIGTILVLDYLDDTVKSKNRLEKIIPVPVLGSIPKHEKGFKEGRE